MEAMWTRFLPTIKEFKKVAEDGRLGDPLVMWGDFLVDFNINSWYSVGCFDWLTHITLMQICQRHTGCWIRCLEAEGC